MVSCQNANSKLFKIISVEINYMNQTKPNFIVIKCFLDILLNNDQHHDSKLHARGLPELKIILLCS